MDSTVTTPLTPEARAKRRELRGNPVRLGGDDGRDWILLDYPPAPDAVWDELHDAAHLRHRYNTAAILRAAVRLLDANYDLNPDESVGLILKTNPSLLVGPVEYALFGPPQPYRGHTQWVRTALIANGLDPDRIHPDDLDGVLLHLVSTGRALAENQFTTIGVFLRKKLQRHAAVTAY